MKESWSVAFNVQFTLNKLDTKYNIYLVYYEIIYRKERQNIINMFFYEFVINKLQICLK